MRGLVLVVFLLSACWTGSRGQKVPLLHAQRLSRYWSEEGRSTLLESVRLQKIDGHARNVILFLGDGMGMSTVTATRILKGQQKGNNGEEELLTFDQFPHVSLSKTYGLDRQTSDSANTATAYLCGVKANYGTIGVDGRARFEDCSSVEDTSVHVDSILKWAQGAGKWTGFVTTTRVTHASPSALYAHSASRNWEYSTPAPDKCKDIARQLVQDSPGKDIRVILGGGVRNFLPDIQRDVHGAAGKRNDSRNLLEEWERNVEERNGTGRIVFNADDLREIDPEETDYLMGLFHTDHLPFVADRPESDKQYPTLAEMTEAAIAILSRSPNGYFLFVEGGSIDLAHHRNYAHKALVEGVEFDRAVGSAVSLTDVRDTLITVTADHSHTFTFGGLFPHRGNSILGIGGVSNKDNLTFTTVGYYNGPGFKEDARQRNLTEEEAASKDFKVDAALPLSYETHGGEDVPVYARGPMAHLFHGVHDQSYIPYVLGYSLCVGPGRDLCSSGSSARSTLAASPWVMALRAGAVAFGAYVTSVYNSV